MGNVKNSIADIIDGGYQVRQDAIDQRHKDDVLNSRLRKKIAEDLSPDLHIDRDAGFLKLAESDFPETRAVIRQGLELASSVRDRVKKTTAEKTRKKYRIFQSRSFDDPQVLHSPIFRFALDPRLIGMVSEYLGYVPILSMVNFWYNPNSFIVRKDDLPFLSDRAPALLGHLDWADNTLVKVFIHCSSVTESNGPVVVLNPQDSARIRDKANYRYANIKNTSDDPCETNGLYLDDGIIRTHLNGAPKTMPLVGEPGTVYVADTSRCFHYGGRNTSTDEARLLGVLLYLRPGALKLSTKYEEILPLQHLSSPSLPLIDRLVLGENINS